jgi:hypothetical protein
MANTSARSPQSEPVNAEQTGGDGGGVVDALRNRVAVGVAVLALIALALMIFTLWGRADDANNETAWARWTFLLAGVEAIAFAGAGFLFGREVNRAAVETAQDQVREANQDARQQAGRAADAVGAGRTLRNAIEAKARTAAGAAPEADVLGDETAPHVPTEMRELADLARATFPDG